MRMCVLEEDVLKVRTARGQDGLVRFECFTITGERDVTQSFALQQAAQHVCQIGRMIVPS